MLVDERVAGAHSEDSGSPARPFFARDGMVVGKMKQFASWFTHGVPHGAQLRKAVYDAKSSTEILDAVDRFFAALLSGEPANGSLASREHTPAEALPA